jgi:hypothetical protein
MQQQHEYSMPCSEAPTTGPYPDTTVLISIKFSIGMYVAKHESSTEGANYLKPTRHNERSKNV